MSKLFVSAAEVLITYRESRPVGFLHHVRPANRSKAEALALARALHKELRQDPARFAQLAARSSDDRLSAELGGELGTFRPLNVMPSIADALGSIEVGEISRVVESEVGFHILKRLAAPRDERVSFSHILIKHEQANGWRRTDRPVTTHTRDEARALAERVAAELARDPGRFVALARQYSESDDVVRDADAGEYGRYEDPGTEFEVMEHVRRAKIGEVSHVFDTAMGFEIVQRTARTAREELFASIITLPYHGAQIERFTPVRRTKERTNLVAQKLLQELKQRPEVFAERRIEYCDAMYCEAAARWRRGNGVPAIELALGKLSPGELAPEPVDTPLGLVILRREAPSAVPQPPPAPIFDYRAVPAIDPARFMREPPDIAAQVGEMGRYALSQLKLTPQRESDYSELFVELDRRLHAEDPANRNVGPHLEWLDERLRALLGEDDYDAFDRQRRRWAAAHTL